MKTTKFFFAAIVAFSLAACSDHHCCCCGGEVEEVKLYGEFSVSANHKVRFSQGNLQRGSNGSWSFAEEQFLYIGNSNNNDWGGYTHDLFGFGQTGYQPALFVEPASTSASDYGGYNVVTKTYSNIDGTNWDWGIRYGITNGGNVPGMWRTLSAAEWDYLLNERPNAENLRCRAMVAGRRGLLILADNYKHPGGVEAIDPEQTYVVGKNTYCYTDWKKMEAGGAIFLPCAGVQNNFNASSEKRRVYEPEMSGYYWTTTLSNSGYSKCVQFGYEAGQQKDLNVFISECLRYYRCAVRLVQEVR